MTLSWRRNGDAQIARKQDSQDSLPEIINITRDRLELTLNRHLDLLARASDWKTPLSVALTLWLLLPVTDFKNKAHLTGAQWQVVVFMLAIASTLWLISALLKLARSPSRKDLLFAICAQADRLDDHRGIFFYRAQDASDTDRILIYYDVVWECYLLPHVSVQAWDLNDVSAEGPLSLYASRLISVPAAQVTVTPLRNLTMRSTKFSEFYKREKRYTFEFLHVVVKAPIRPDMKNASFLSGGREYKWMSIPELLHDPHTAERNSDVIHHMEGHFAEFFLQTPDSLQNEIVGSPTPASGSTS
jgi:hypothetical protein